MVVEDLEAFGRRIESCKYKRRVDSLVSLTLKLFVANFKCLQSLKKLLIIFGLNESENILNVLIA